MAALNRRKLLLLILLRRRRARRLARASRKGRIWVRQIFSERTTKGEYHTLVQEMRLHDHEYFFKQFRMSPARFDHLLSLISWRITKCSLRREVISPAERLSITLRYLVSGDSQVSIASSYRVSPSSVGIIIDETCHAIWEELINHGYIRSPDNRREWESIAGTFEELWDFPNCVGALDGKHIVMQCPAGAGSSFFNYKKTHSIVLMAVCNANYEFILIDIGDSGRNSDGGVFANSNMGIAMNENKLGIPPARKLPGTNIECPYVFVADEAFPLKTYMVKPYARATLTDARRICNYRISRARRVIENCFGICASRFRIFRRPIIRNVDTVVGITKAIVALHNYLMHHESKYCPPGFTDINTTSGWRNGDWRIDAQDNQGLVSINHQGSNNFTRSAHDVRESFCDYFNSDIGAVSWQNELVFRTN